MIHWGFLILAFAAGFAACYRVMYWAAQIYGRVMEAVGEGAKAARF